MKLIETTSDLSELCKSLSTHPWLAIDTEFERVNTYYPELCLVQIQAGETTALIDPLAIDDLQPLYDLLYDSSITKVFHSARQDLEIFFHLKGEVPQPIFDTQIAAELRGHDSQIGYANLVREVLDVSLEKSQTRTDWKKRPLSDKQLQYAADDVIYLAQLYEKLLAKLQEHKQLELMQTRCESFNNADLYEPDPETMWKKIKIRDVKKFNAEQQSRLQSLTAWRETTARKQNRPRKWILKDHTLFELARDCPTERQQLSDITDMSDKLIIRYGDVLLGLMN